MTLESIPFPEMMLIICSILFSIYYNFALIGKEKLLLSHRIFVQRELAWFFILVAIHIWCYFLLLPKVNPDTIAKKWWSYNIQVKTYVVDIAWNELPQLQRIAGTWWVILVLLTRWYHTLVRRRVSVLEYVYNSCYWHIRQWSYLSHLDEKWI